MKIKVETEKKYYSMEPELLLKKAEELNFKQIKKVYETDEYFTDIESQYIKNRTCLRIRKQDNGNMEITYKGKSNLLSGQYCKLENNISCKIDEYDNFVNLFSSLGYYSYVTVEKERLVYELKSSKYIYNIMIDKLPSIGGFVEFEIISEKEDSSKSELKYELDNFILLFKDFKLKEANDPYRDIVAKSIYEKIVNNNKSSKLYINIDEEMLKYEKDFFKKYREKISAICNTKVKWGTYKKNIDIDAKIGSLINEYIDNLIFDSKELLVTSQLLKRLDYDYYFITEINELFFNRLFEKLNITHKSVIYLKQGNINKSIKNTVNINKEIIIANKSLKEINSILLIIINNKNI